MLKVFKYPIRIGDYFELDLPKEAQILKVECQFGEPQLWALVDPSESMEKRRFRFAGTGHPIMEEKNNLKYINTFQVNNGTFIFHIFEIIK